MMRVVKIAIVLAIVLLLADVNVYADSDSRLIKERVKTIGVFIYGARNEMSSEKSPGLKKKLFSRGKAPIFGGGIEIIDDSVQPLKKADKRYETYSKVIKRFVLLCLKQVGYKTIYLNNKEFIANSYSGKRISEIIDLAKEKFEDIDAVLFVFYSANNSCQSGNVVYYGLFLDGNLVMYGTDTEKTRLSEESVSANHLELPDEKIMNRETKGFFGVESTEKSFYHSDVLTNFVQRMLSKMNKKFPRINKRTKTTARVEFSEKESSIIDNIAMFASDGTAYLTADVGLHEAKGTAREFFERACVGLNDRALLEFNLKNGDMFILIEIKDIDFFFTQEDFEPRKDISDLQKVIANKLGDTANLESLKIAVMINGSNGRVLGTVASLNPKNIKDAELQKHITAYIENNFEDSLYGRQSTIILDVYPDSTEIDVRGIALDLDKENIKNFVNSLKSKDKRLQKVGAQIEKLVDLVGGEPGRFWELNFVTSEKGNCEIHVKIESETLLRLPKLLTELGIKKNSLAHRKLSKKIFREFTVDSKDTYALDNLLKSYQYKMRIVQANVLFNNVGAKSMN